ncbi:MAG: hypothetical protein A2X77_04645 [Gammaproteobacteria bacterium GWE2_42_36]|nr:MAG: hypothetical protein A2X77_04645 [Gammaproteobacteria bacterium GWE2_42_36]
MNQLTIGKLSTLTDASTVTIRFYEKRGLIKPSGRSPAKYRLYSPAIVDQIVFIKNAQDVGFTLREIKSLIDLLNSKKATSRDIRENTLSKVKEIQEKIVTLKNMQKILERWASACDGKMPIEDCPILKKLFQPTKRIMNSKKEK